ncbi:MAG: signal peptidase I [Smithellaceae bacterium]|nr:signal peptidase I [Smithellaceae bacterium]
MTNIKSKFREYLEAIVIAVLIALFIRSFIVQAFKIPSGSMLPTLQIGDHILVSKFSYGIKIPFTRKILIPTGKPQREDILVFVYPEDPSKDFIKRVIAIAGDTVRIIDKKLYINGEPYADPHGSFTDMTIIPGDVQPRDNYGPTKIPPGHVFVMGDNRDHSYDSRFWGFVRLDDTVGKAFIIYWSWNRDDFAVRWNRLGNILR